MTSDHTAVKDFVLMKGSLRIVSWFDTYFAVVGNLCLVGAHPSQRFGKGSANQG